MRKIKRQPVVKRYLRPAEKAFNAAVSAVCAGPLGEPFPAGRPADPVYVFAMREEVKKAASDKYDSEMIGPCTDATVVVEEIHMAPVNLNDSKCSAGKFRMAHQSRVAERPAVATTKLSPPLYCKTAAMHL